MADHSLPTLTSLYTSWASSLGGRIADVMLQNDPAHTTLSNFPTNTVRFSSAANKWQKWNGSAWNDLSSAYAINISGNAATATALQTARTINGVSFNGTANITLTANTTNSLTFVSTAGNAANTTFNGSAARSIGYASVGAPSVNGTNATGTWAIGISGNAATATSAGTVTGTVASGAVGTTQAAKTANTSIATTAFVDRMRDLATSTTTGTLVASDRGCLVSLTAGVTVPASVFSDNNVVTLYNNSASAITITQGASLTLRLAGTANTGNRSLAQRGIATIVFISATEAVIYGGGLS